MKINGGFGHKASYAIELVSLLRGRVWEGAGDMSRALEDMYSAALSRLYQSSILNLQRKRIKMSLI